MKKKKEENYKIGVYENLYPVTLYVAKLEDWEGVVSKFDFYRTTSDLRNAKDNVKIDAPRNIGGVTYLVREKDSEALGILILLGDSQCSTLAHESIHYADAVYDYLYMNGEGYDQGNEQYAYLVTWCVDQLDEFLQYRNKQKKVNGK